MLTQEQVLWELGVVETVLLERLERARARVEAARWLEDRDEALLQSGIVQGLALALVEIDACKREVECGRS